MIGRRIYPRELPADMGPPPLEVTFFHGWDSWLFGAELERHPREWLLQLRLGPVGLWIQGLS